MRQGTWQQVSNSIKCFRCITFLIWKGQISKVSDEFEFGFLDTLMKYSKHKHCIGVYFLRYVKGSFTRMHHDNNTDLTIVTLLDDVDLVGGHSLVMERYDQRARPANEYCVETEAKKHTHPMDGR